MPLDLDKEMFVNLSEFKVFSKPRLFGDSFKRIRILKIRLNK